MSSLPAPTPPALIRTFQAGQAALAQLVQHYRPHLIRWGQAQIDARLRGRTTASDVFQEACVHLWQRLGGVLEGATEEAFLARG
jgi:DNA-directed RNA polymerase specialized sigma24 family protein